MAKLADETSQAAADLGVIESARSLLDTQADEALLWALVPEAALKLVGSGPEFKSSVARQLPQSLARAVVRRTGPSLRRVGPVLFVSTSIQHERVLAPVVEALSPQFGAGRVDFLPRLSPTGFIRASRAASSASHALESSREVVHAAGSGNFGEMVCQTSIHLERARRLFAGANCPVVVVVATQHGAAARAVIRAAVESERTHVVYVPHAPVARNAWYHDLPAHWALLRGSAEVEVYSSLGVDGQRLRVVGDPSMAGAHLQSEPSGAQVLYAMSTDNLHSLGEDVSVLVEAGCDDVDVCMHPRLRTRVDLRSAFPSRWTVSDSPSTFARMLTTSPSAVVQHGSGVGLEALSLGLPLIDLCNPGREPNYHYLGGPPAANVASSEQLRNELGSIERSPSACAARRAYARRWMAEGGEQAAASVAQSLADIVEQPLLPNLLLDGWMRSDPTSVNQ